MRRRNFLKGVLLSPFLGLFKKKESPPLMMCNGDSFVIPADNKGKLVECYVEARIGQREFLFFCHDDGTITPNLERYAIIPVEKWEQLTGRKF